jgi:NADPH-dependent ferric siderophore reductase
VETAPITSPFGEPAIETIEHLNDEHDDTVAFMARVLGGVGAIRSAQLRTVDHDGIEIEALDAEGDRHAVTLAFASRAESSDDADRQLCALLADARQRASDEPLTSIELEMTAGAIPTWITTVTSIVDITPRMRQITVSGGLDGFRPLAPDQFVYVLAPPQGRTQLTIGTDFSWERYNDMPEADRPVGAYYTVRRWDRGANALDLWVVLHGHDGDGERWARSAAVGDPVGLWGPRQAYERPERCRSLLLLGDETALPAIAAILESLPAGDRATVMIGVHEQPVGLELRSAAEVSIAWIDDAGDHPLLDAVQRRAGEIDADTYVWGGAESRQISAVRRFVRDTIGLPRDQVSLTGYWRAGAAR